PNRADHRCRTNRFAARGLAPFSSGEPCSAAQGSQKASRRTGIPLDVIGLTQLTTRALHKAGRNSVAGRRLGTFWLSVSLLSLVCSLAGTRNQAQAAGVCRTSWPSNYDVTICITSPGQG